MLGQLRNTEHKPRRKEERDERDEEGYISASVSEFIFLPCSTSSAVDPAIICLVGGGRR